MTGEREMLIHIVDIVLRPKQFLNEPLVDILDVIHVLLGFGLPWQDDPRLGMLGRVVGGQDVLFVNLLIGVALHVDRGHHGRGGSQVESAVAGVLTPGGGGADFFDEEFDLLSQLGVVFEHCQEIASFDLAV